MELMTAERMSRWYLRNSSLEALQDKVLRVLPDAAGDAVVSVHAVLSSYSGGTPSVKKASSLVVSSQAM